jgi:hypothetical protein
MKLGGGWITLNGVLRGRGILSLIERKLDTARRAREACLKVLTVFL